jgi:hypothetical protein
MSGLAKATILLFVLPHVAGMISTHYHVCAQPLKMAEMGSQDPKLALNLDSPHLCLGGG